LKFNSYCVFAYSIPIADELARDGFEPDTSVIFCKKQGKE